MDKKAKARVAIAMDVLQNADRLVVTNNGWYLADVPVRKKAPNGAGIKINFARRFYGDKTKDARKILPKLRKCQVCALGACLISQIGLFDKVSISELVKGGRIDVDVPAKFLQRFFSTDQLRKIESAFEADSQYTGVRGLPCSESADFGKRFHSPKKRLKAIMANIIVNDGTFVPEWE